MNHVPHNPQAEKTLMDDLAFLEHKLEELKREKQELYDKLQHQHMLTSGLQTELDRIYRSKSWRWTACMRRYGEQYRRSVYGLLAHIKKLWEEMGSPCPRLVRFCRHTLLGRFWPVREHPSSDTSAPTPLEPARATADVAAVVLCAESAAHAAEALQSVLSQTMPPREILLIDATPEHSAEDTAQNYAAQNVQYLPTADSQTLHGTALERTDAGTLLFLPEKNVLHPEFIRCGMDLLKHSPGPSLCYSTQWSFGAEQKQLQTPAELSAAQAHILSEGCMVKRETLASVRAASSLPAAFEQLLSAGHRSAQSQGMCFVRTEKQQSSHGLKHAVLCIPLSGRTWAWPLTTSFLEQQTYPHDLIDLVVLDTSQNNAFGTQVKGWLSQCDYRSHTYLQEAVGEPGIADLPRAQMTDAVCDACVRIFNCLRPYCTAPVALFLEDDVVPPQDAYTRLSALLGKEVVSASGLYRHRGNRKPVAWNWDEHGFPSFPKENRGITTIGGSGFGCIATRGDVVRSFQFSSEQPFLNYDHMFFRAMVRDGPWQALLDWSCVCRHYSSTQSWV